MFRIFVQDVVGFFLLVQSVEVVLCAFTRVISLRGSVGTTAKVTSLNRLNRRDIFQSHHLVSLSGAARKRRHSQVASRFWTRSCNGSRLLLCWALDLCFVYTFVFGFYSRAREEREKARCDRRMNGLPLRHVVSIKKCACHHKVTLPSLSCAATRFPTVLSLEMFRTLFPTVVSLERFQTLFPTKISRRVYNEQLCLLPLPYK